MSVFFFLAPGNFSKKGWGKVGIGENTELASQGRSDCQLLSK